jgi:hypothetical protein
VGLGAILAVARNILEACENGQTKMIYLNYYVHCRTEWTDEWDCMCNDECPACQTKDIEPYQSQEINDGILGEIIRHVPSDWVPQQGWPAKGTE